MKPFIRIIFILFWLLSFSANATDIQVKVDRTIIELNETFTLTFEANGEPDDEPDFSPLEKDFQILNKSTGSNISIINGQYTRSKKWRISLVALHEGNISIPPIHFGNDVSPGYQVTINQPQKSTGKQGEAFISELIISSDTAYPQEQIIVTQRLLSSSNINAYEFSPLKTSGIEIIEESLSDIKQYQTKRGNTAYLVLEQSYAIYPQSAGKLLIEPSIATARIALQGSRGNRSAFDPFRNNTKTLRRSSRKKNITIKSVPSAFKGKHWLVAKEVQLVEEFPESTKFKTGEPVTRTLLLLADGQNSSQLPELITQDVKGLKQYPDKPLLKNNINDEGITGVQQLKIALIPSSSGSYTLPAMSIPWWNTQTDTLEIAEIKARTFTVGNISDTPHIKAPNEKTPDVNITTENIKTLPVKPVNIESPDNTLPWKVISFLLTVALLITLFLLWKRKSVSTLTTDNIKHNEPSLKQAIRDLKQSCETADAQASKNALLLWGQALFTDKPVHSLGDLSGKVDEQLASKINALNSFLYRDSTEQWECSELFDLCVQFTKDFKIQSKTETDPSQLESLYK